MFEISAEMDSLQNKKVELVFLQVKKQIKTENLDISSGSILPLLEVLRNNNQLKGLETLADEKIFSTEEARRKSRPSSEVIGTFGIMRGKRTVRAR